MFNSAFLSAVRLHAINILSRGLPSSQATAPAAAPASRYRPDDAVAFVDLQNLHHFLRDNCRVPATQVHIPNMLREFAEMHALQLREICIFTGIHDPAREPDRYESMMKRLRWFERRGCRVTTLQLSYYTDRSTQEVRAQEKGIDVRIASEILRALDDGLSRALVFTQDKDIAQALKVANEMAAKRCMRFQAYSPVLEGADWEHNGRCGIHGIAFTCKLPFHVDLARKHVRPERTDRALGQRVASQAPLEADIASVSAPGPVPTQAPNASQGEG
jgi:uncharacterized LabA/DUF88 family protein